MPAYNFCIAIGDHIAKSKAELELNIDDVIRIHAQGLNGFWIGLNERTQSVGSFPSNKVKLAYNGTSSVKIRCLYDYSETSSNFGFKQGDILSIHNFIEESEGWWRGKFEERYGVFPKKFVEIIESNDLFVEIGIARFPFRGSEGFLTFRAGDSIQITHKDPSSTWYGMIPPSSVIGKFPSNYITIQSKHPNVSTPIPSERKQMLEEITRIDPARLRQVETNDRSVPILPANKKLQSIIYNRRLVLLFRDFLHANFNSENLAFWFDIEDFKKLEDQKEINKQGRIIFEKYLSEGAKYELNLPNQIAKEILSLFEDHKVHSTNLDPSLFNKAQNDIWNLLELDCFPKFIETDSYKTFIENPEHNPTPQSSQNTVPDPSQRRKWFGRQLSISNITRSRANTLHKVDKFFEGRPDTVT